MKRWIAGLLAVSFGMVFLISAREREELKSGESAIFLNNGDRVIGEITDISSKRLVLELKDGQKIQLSKLWMINFVGPGWNFPEERKKITTDEHYFFLKNNDVVSGKLVDYSSKRHVFELEKGDKIEHGRVRRIYFEKKAPQELLDKLKEREEKLETVFTGTYIGDVIGLDKASHKITLILKDDKTAEMRSEALGGKIPILNKGTWVGKLEDKTVTVNFTEMVLGATASALAGTIVFKLENDMLTAVQYDKNVFKFDELKLKKQQEALIRKK